MQRTFIYYLAIILPLAALVVAARSGWTGNAGFVAGLFVYIFIYRTCTDTLRLAAKGVLPRRHFWKMLLPASRVKFFRALYLP